MLLPLVPKVLDFQFSGMSGKGIGRYGAAQLNDITLTPGGAPHALKENMVLGTLTWHATPDFDMYVAGGREQEDSYLTSGVNGKAFVTALPCWVTTTAIAWFTGAATDCTGQTRQISQEAAGFTWKFYQGKFGKVQFGMSTRTPSANCLPIRSAMRRPLRTTWSSPASVTTRSNRRQYG